MSLPDRNNPYAFDRFLEWRNSVDYYADDPFFQKVLKHYCGNEFQAIDSALRNMSRKASFRWRDLSILPRLYRDSAVNELWEGPRNVLLMQIHRDCQRASEWYSPGELVSNILRGADDSTVKELGDRMEELVACPNLIQVDEKTMAACREWDRFCHDLMHACQDRALEEISA